MIFAHQQNVSEYTPGIIIVGGRGKTVPEYGGGGGTKYNKKKLNEDLSQMDEFVIYPDNVNIVDVEDEKNQEEDQDDGDDEDSDLEILPNNNHNRNQARKLSVLGKRKNKGVRNSFFSKKRKIG